MSARRLFVPSIGTTLILAEPWTFDVWNEHRNDHIFPLVHDVIEQQWGKIRGKATLPAMTKLVVDRIYIKKGAPQFDSITFRANNYRADKSMEFFAALQDKKLKNVMRFWVKLTDANNIVFESQE